MNDIYTAATIAMAATETRVNDESRRVQPAFSDRQRFEEACTAILESHGYPYEVLNGDGPAREAQAVRAVNRLIVQETSAPAPNP